MALAADSKQLYIPLSTIYGKKSNDGNYLFSPLDIKNLNDNLYAISKKIQGNLTLSDLTKVAVDTLTSATVITNELYSNYGNVANLTVSKVRTDYEKAQRYLNEDTSDLDYVFIQNEEIELRTATTDGTETEQLSEDGDLFYWVDDTHAQMTKEHITAYPVIVYKYKELVKASFKFERVYRGGVCATVPVLTFGVGNGNDVFSKAKMWKDTNGLRLEYRTLDGDFVPVTLLDSGFSDLSLRRVQSFSLNSTNSTVTLQLEGETFNYPITYSDGTDDVVFSFPDGFSTTVTIA
jgi:hypothetical protein